MKLPKVLFTLVAFGTLAVFLTGCHGPRHSDKYFPSHLLERIDDHVEDLNLTENQNEQYQHIRERLEADLIKHRDSHKLFKTELLEIIDRQDSGVNDITLKLRKKTGNIPEMLNLYLDYIDEFYEILDDQQKAMLMEEIRDKADSRYFRR